MQGIKLDHIKNKEIIHVKVFINTNQEVILEYLLNFCSKIYVIVKCETFVFYATTINSTVDERFLQECLIYEPYFSLFTHLFFFVHIIMQNTVATYLYKLINLYIYSNWTWKKSKNLRTISRAWIYAQWRIWWSCKQQCIAVLYLMGELQI